MIDDLLDGVAAGPSLDDPKKKRRGIDILRALAEATDEPLAPRRDNDVGDVDLREGSTPQSGLATLRELAGEAEPIRMPPIVVSKPPKAIAPPSLAPRDVTEKPIGRGVVDRPLTGVARDLPAAARAAYETIEPQREAAKMIAAPVTSALTAGRFIGQKLNDERDPDATDVAAAMGVPRISDREGLVAGAQLGAVGLGGALNRGVTGLVAKLAQRAGLAGDVAETGVVGGVGRLAPTVGAATEGAAIGAAYDPEKPGRGALIGGALGTAADVAARARFQRPAPEPLPTTRQLARPPQRTTAQTLDQTAATTEPDYEVSPEQPVGEAVRVRAAAPVSPPPRVVPEPTQPGVTPPEHVAVRVGPITADGAYFERTAGAPSEGAVPYDLRDVHLADGTDAATVQRITSALLEDPSLTPAQREHVAGVQQLGVIDAATNDTLPIARVAQQLGYDGLQVAPVDPTEPPSVFVWNIRTVKPASVLPPEAPPVEAPDVEARPVHQFRDIITKSPEEIRRIADEETAADESMETDLFGVEGAKRYERLQRKANSTMATDEAINQAVAEIEKMEGALTEQQRNRLFGIGQKGLNAEELREAARAVAPVDDWPTKLLLSNVGREMTTGEPHRNTASALRLRESLRVLQERTGQSAEQVLAAAINARLGSGYLTSPAQGQELLAARMADLRRVGFFSGARPVDASRARHGGVAGGIRPDVNKLLAAESESLVTPGGSAAPSRDEDQPGWWQEQEREARAAERPAATKTYDYSSTQLDLPPEHAAAIRQLGATIPDAHLAEDGREDAPHITVKYGLHGNEPEKVRALLADQPPITVTLGKTSIFPDSGSGDVVKVDVDSPALHAVNKKIADAFPHTDTHPGYKPHATVAYVKKGLGTKYAGNASLEGRTITFDRLTFSGKDGTKVEIPLGGARRPLAAPSDAQLPRDLDTPEIRALDARAAAIPRTDAIDTPARNEWRHAWIERLARFERKGYVAHLVLGLPGSGKSSVLAKPLKEAAGAALLDNDRAKEDAPEYHGGLGATALHPETVQIRNAALARVVAQGGNLVFPTVGDPERTVALARQLLDAGYTVHVHMADVPPDVSAHRVLEGYREGTRHFISPRAILEYGANPRRGLAALAQLDGVIVHDPLDNDVPRGAAPHPVPDWRERWGFPDAEPPGGTPAVRPGDGPDGGRTRGGGDSPGPGGRDHPEAPEASDVDSSQDTVNEDGVSRFVSARAPSGVLRPVARVSTRGLLQELLDLEPKRAAAESRSIYELRDDPNFHTSGIPQVVSTKPKGGGPSMQAKAAQNLKGYAGVTERIYAELAGRMPADDIWPAVDDLRAELDERRGTAGDFEYGAHQRDVVRDESGAVLFSPADEGPDLFGNAPAPTAADQRSLFGAKEGTEAARSLRQTEAAARAEIARLRPLVVAPGGNGRAAAARIAELERLVNRDRAITPQEMRTRAAAESDPVEPLFSPAAPGQPLSAAAAAARGTPPPSAQEVREVKSLAEIARTLAQLVDVPLRQGRFLAGARRAAGAFFPQREVARVIRFDKLDTVAHEIGHFLSQKYLRNPTMGGAAARGAPPLPMAAKRELVQMGKALYGTRKPSGGYGEEGIAQWARFYVTDPARLANEAPSFAAWADANLLAKEPALKAALDQTRADFAEYQAAPATARVDAMLDVTPSRRFLPTARRLMTTMIDDLAEIRRAVGMLGTGTNPSRNAYILARLTRGGAGMAEEMIEHGIVDPTTQRRVTRGIAQVLGQLTKEDVQPFRRYLVAERTLELAARGIDPGITVADATDVVARYGAKYRSIAEELWTISSALIDYRQKKGLLTADEARTIKEKNTKRVGFYRVFDDDERASGGRGAGKGFGRNSSGVQSIKGSARPIIDPLESLLTDVYRTVQQSHAADVLSALVEHADHVQGGGRVIEVLTERPKRAVRINVADVQEQLADLGFEIPNGGLEDVEGVLTAFEPLSQASAKETKDLVRPLVIRGERKWIQIADAPLYDALNGLGTPQMSAVWRWVSMPTRVLRAGATLTAEFIARNPVRDAWSAAIYSRAGTRPPGWDFGRGLFHVLKADHLYEDWRLDGGDNAAMLGLDRVDAHKHVAQLLRSPARKAADWVLRPIDTLRVLSSLFENATRVGEYAGLRTKFAKEGMAEPDARAAAALGSRDVTIDFARAGEYGRQVNQIVAFFNANAQGWDKLAREFRHNPESVIPRLLAFITIPSVLLYLLQKDDPAYQEVPAWQKGLAWVIVQRGTPRRLSTGRAPTREEQYAAEHGDVEHIWRIPKPPDLGVLFGTVPERILEWVNTKNPHVLDRALNDLSTLNPLHIPNAIGPLTEWWANKSWFTDRPIVPEGLANLPPGEQATSRTGELARLVGRTTHLSPAKLENAAKGAAGGLATYGMDLGNLVVRGGRSVLGLPALPHPEQRRGDALATAPLVKGFAVRMPQLDAQSVEEALDQFNTADAYRQAWRRKLEAGDRAGARDYFKAHEADIRSVAGPKDGLGRTGYLHDAHALIVDAQRVSRDASEDERARVADVAVRAARAALSGDRASRLERLRLRTEANALDRKGQRLMLRSRFGTP